jgi:ATP-dependent exoDNAse (exonuclease V) alpha subunit
MRVGRGQVEPILTHKESSRLTREQSSLTSVQKAAIQHVLTSRDRVQGIQGVAGAGKTTTLSVIRAAAHAKGYEVEGFAPTSRAAKQLREAGISAGTLQGFLMRASRAEDGPQRKTLYFVDESSLASTGQMQQLLERLGPHERLVLIGDTRQHQAVEAGRPFQQLHEAGMNTAKVDQIVRQRDQGLRAAVEHLARGEVATGIAALEKQHRITEIADPTQRIRAIAKDFANDPSDALAISPDNASRRQLNDAIRSELQARGTVSNENHGFKVWIPEQDRTGADRRWAASYNIGDILRYSRGSHLLGIGSGSYARVVSTDFEQNLLSVQKKDGGLATYDPRRLTGVSIYREIEQQFAVGDRLQFTAPDKSIGVANRDLGRLERISPEGELQVRLEGGRLKTFDSRVNPHFDHGYAVTSHSAQGLTADRVLINVDSTAHPDLVNSRFAYVSVSRARDDAQIYTNDASSLATRLGSEVSKSSALEAAQTLGQSVTDVAGSLS